MYPWELVPRLDDERVSEVDIVPVPLRDLPLLFRGREVYDSPPKSAPSASASAASRAASAASGSKNSTGWPWAKGPNSCWEEVTEPVPVPEPTLGLRGDVTPKAGPLPCR